MGIIPEMRKKVCLGFEAFSAELKQSVAIANRPSGRWPSRNGRREAAIGGAR
jgi:hypothetical protein